ncbi:MAG: hypothetical protein P4L99_05525 [Chthoniobacter sp.]|nr:hypothetical protein [Chthoniobacter sp.]
MTKNRSARKSGVAKKPSKATAASVDRLKVTSAEAARLLGVTPRWVRELAAQGFIKKLGRDEYSLADVVQGYAKSLAEDGRQTAQSTSATRVLTARAEELERRVERQLEELIEVDQVLEFNREIVETLERDLLPVWEAIDDPEAKLEVRKNTEAALNRLRATFEAARLRLLAGKPIDDGAKD